MYHGGYPKSTNSFVCCDSTNYYVGYVSPFANSHYSQRAPRRRSRTFDDLFVNFIAAINAAE
jgi:hypothetical protein